ncbi:BsuPI-related putative proteinase inhibitor [Bacillus safensis]|uniref:Intracellular proteinase inhibitor n=1 Tax=Bacillus safensis TaxID=561879 RepID=A0A5C0WDV4_BACIA|nr:MULTISPECIES: BsuPI-related putative proteinase inhibitor [Bacillus]PNU23712.1 proteinase inhibitor [Bacillus stratosphericus]AYJ89637.1 proteinase inhibitor [Bacillus safensis]KEP31405.1 proteinase inhibitor [Bacillus safensis]KIL22267.1 hypothetical protein B4134_1174 [Bacillus safensis]MBG9821698.1 proteinase inhibitor [Bacillus safensis]
MKKGLVLLLILLVLAACGQQKKDEPDKEVSGQMGEKTVELTVDPVQKGSSVQFNMSLKNESDRDFEFTFNTSQKFELSVYDENGNEQYRYSKDRMFTQAIQTFVLKKGEAYDFQDTWSNGVKPGTYEAVVTFKGKAEGLKQITEKKTFQVK